MWKKTTIILSLILAFILLGLAAFYFVNTIDETNVNSQQTIEQKDNLEEESTEVNQIKYTVDVEKELYFNNPKITEFTINGKVANADKELLFFRLYDYDNNLVKEDNLELKAIEPGKEQGFTKTMEFLPINLLDGDAYLLISFDKDFQNYTMVKLIYKFEENAENTNENNIVNEENNEENTSEENPVNQENITIKVYFLHNAPAGMPDECSFTQPVERKIPYTLAVARAAIEELLKGPTTEEKQMKYYSVIPEGTKLNDIYIKNKTAYVDFSNELDHIGGTCAIQGLYAEIENTLKQFPTIDNVVISINGQTEDILQP